MTVPAGIEPATFRLTAERSKPTELWDLLGSTGT
jgi:hypothetical protein